MARVDLHAHVLPGIDDGARCLAESVEMCRAAAADGTRTLVATPHVRPDHVTSVAVLADLVAELRAALCHAAIPIDLRQGGELAHTMVGRLDQASLDAIALGPRHARWLLVETPFARLDAAFHEATEELRDRGFAVMLAHPERSEKLLEDGARGLARELDHGCLLQVGAWALAGGHGEEAEDQARRLARSGRVSAIATDAHPGWRRPELSVGARAARAAGLSAVAAERLVGVRPAALLERGARPVFAAA